MVKAAFLFLFQQIVICQTASIEIYGYIINLNGNTIVAGNLEDYHISFIEDAGTIYDGEVSIFVIPEEGELYLVYNIQIGTDAIGDDQIIHNSPSLNQNYPNPFNPSTIIKARTPEAAKFEIFDIAGRQIISTLLETPGEYSLCWGGLNALNKPVSAGIYFYRLTGKNYSISNKMILLDGGRGTGLSKTYLGGIGTRMSKPSYNTSMVGTIQLSSPTITDVSLPVVVNQDTFIVLQTNEAPHGPDNYPLIFVVDLGDTFVTDLNHYLYNDSPTIFSIPEIDEVSLNGSVLSYSPIVVDTLTIEIVGVDSMDTALRDTTHLQIASREPLPSSDFTWESNSMGRIGSYFNDVSFIDTDSGLETLAIGRIITDSVYYNTARWSSQTNEWQLMNIINAAPLYSIFVFNENDIWVTKIGYPVHWDGETWTQYNLTELGLNVSPGQGCWGTSSSNMYFVGENGAIVHYDGSSFTIMASNTDVRLIDIAGTSSTDIWVVGQDSDHSRSVLLHYNGSLWEQQYFNDWSQEQDCDSICGNLRSVWNWGDKIFLAGTGGVWEKNIGDSTWSFWNVYQIVPTGLYPNMIRGNNAQDVIVVGNYAKTSHYNGEDWTDISLDAQDVMLYGVALQDSTAIVVGRAPGGTCFYGVGHR